MIRSRTRCWTGASSWRRVPPVSRSSRACGCWRAARASSLKNSLQKWRCGIRPSFSACGKSPKGDVSDTETAGVIHASVDAESRRSWQALLEALPEDVPFKGVVHLEALHGHGSQATTEHIAEDVKRVGASALALVQGLSDCDATPENGIWFITRGAQVLERELNSELVGATLWGLGKVVTLEAAHLQPRMIDLDPGTTNSLSDLVNDLMYPDRENHVAYRFGRRMAARLVRLGAASPRLALPDDSDWVLTPHRDGVFDKPEIKRLPTRTLEPREVLVSVEAMGLNFWDVFRSLGFIEGGRPGQRTLRLHPRKLAQKLQTFP